MVVRRGYDHGFSSPACVLWCAQLTEDIVGRWGGSHGRGESKNWQRIFKKDSLVILDEIYFWTGKPNEGVRWSPAQIADAIRDKESRFNFPVVPGAADTSIYSLGEGSVANEMSMLGITFVPGDKSQGSRIRGWAKINELFMNALEDPAEKPGLFITENATNLIRTLPLLERDTARPDDIQSTGVEDHGADVLRYLALQIPRTLKTKKVIGF